MATRNGVVLPADPAHDVVIVVPTVADRATLAPTFARLVADAQESKRGDDPVRVGLVLSINSPNPAEAMAVAGEAEALANEAGVDLVIAFAEQPIGFSAANNRGLMAAISQWKGCAELVVFHNDDAHVPPAFARRMLAALRTEVVHGYSEHWGEPGGLRKDRPASAYGPIGMVGPLSNLVAGIQQVTEVEFLDGRRLPWRGHVESFDAAVRQRFREQRVTADFLSGFCVGLRREAIAGLLFIRAKHEGVSFLLQGIDAAMTSGDAVGTRGWIDLSKVSIATDGTVTWVGEARNPWEMRAIGPWDEDSYPIAGYEDNDLCVRMELAGWRGIVAADIFVGHIGHQTFDRLFPEMQRGMRNRVAYYERWRHLTRPEGGHRVGGVFRLRFEVAHDVVLFRIALQRTAELVDSIAVVLTANPLDIMDDPRWPTERGLLQEEDVAFLRACSDAPAEVVAAELRKWVAVVVASREGNRLGADPGAVAERVVVDVWSGAFDERAERNRSIELAEGQGATWILSVDHDEVVENRVTRELVDRIVSHPDPLVRAYDQSWVNHWDADRLYRIDRPWGDGNTWTGGMHGFRLFRTGGQRRIFAGTANGLHCGNTPDHDSSAKRISGIRFRHFGYLRAEDRLRKHRRYQEQDPNPDPLLTGNAGLDAYSHIVHDEGMTMSPFFALNGIGLHVLMHRGESANDLARVLDLLHGLADRMVLVWTDEWSDEDLAANLLPAAPEDLARQEERDGKIAVWHAWMAEHGGDASRRAPKRPPRLLASRLVRPEPVGGLPTGPSAEVLAVAEAFGASWVHHPLRDDLGAARNAGIDALSMRSNGLGWSLFVDLDEHFPEAFAALVALRRMAEASDTDAWLFPFANAHVDGTSTRSESYRLARLLPNMRLTGRVHETFDHALGEIRAGGRMPRIRVAPFEMAHYGLAKTDAAMDAKLARYRRLLLLELADRPYNAAAWVALGLALENDGNTAQAHECLVRAVRCPGDGYLAPRELALHYLRLAKPWFGLALERSEGHSWHRANRDLGRALALQIPDLPLLGSPRHRRGEVPEPIELPAFPDNEVGFPDNEVGSDAPASEG